MDDRRTSILAAALEMATSYGFRRTSMDDIARAAGISRPTLYQYFSGKDALFTAAIDYTVTQAFAAGEAAAETAPTASVERLAAYLAAVNLYWYGLLIAGPHGDEFLDTSNKLGRDKTAAARRHLVGEVNRIAGLAPDDETGQILVAAAEGLKFRAPDAAVLERWITELVRRWLT